MDATFQVEFNIKFTICNEWENKNRKNAVSLHFCNHRNDTTRHDTKQAPSPWRVFRYIDIVTQVLFKPRDINAYLLFLLGPSWGSVCYIQFNNYFASAIARLPSPLVRLFHCLCLCLSGKIKQTPSQINTISIMTMRFIRYNFFSLSCCSMLTCEWASTISEWFCINFHPLFGV